MQPDEEGGAHQDACTRSGQPPERPHRRIGINDVLQDLLADDDVILLWRIRAHEVEVGVLKGRVRPPSVSGSHVTAHFNGIEGVCPDGRYPVSDISIHHLARVLA